MTDSTPQEAVVLEFDLVRKEQLISLKENGVALPHVLVEMDGTLRDAYMNELNNKNFKQVPSGKRTTTQIRDFSGMHASLLSRTLHSIAADGTRTLVPATKIASWPISTQEKLFDLAQKLCGLNEDEEEGKND